MCTCSLLSNPNQEERNITFRMPTFNMPTFRMPTFRIEPHEWEVIWEILGMEPPGIYPRWLVLGGSILLFAIFTYMWICSLVAYMMGYSFATCFGVGV